MSGRISNQISNMARSSKIGGLAIEIAISEVLLFVLYGVTANAIKTANSSANGTPFTGTNATLVTLVTLFYLLGAALVPLALVHRSGYL